MIGMTVCSGVGAPEHAAPWIDWRYQSEIDPFAAAVLRERFPDAVNLGDMTRYKEWPDAAIDVLCGGTPCQSFSVAGLRKGLDDPRGNLMLTYLAIVDRYKPRWVVWENVPGVLSSGGGRDFASFLGGLGQLGYGWAYRVLDVQYGRTLRFPWAIPQRRRRVFVVGYLGDWRRAAEVLLERESLSRHPPPRREAGQGTAPTLAARTRGGGGLGTDFDLDGGLVADVAGCLASSGGHAVPGNSVQDADQGYLLPVANSGDVSYAICASGQQSLDAETETLIALSVATPWAVRRLLPIECERLMGFPDNWTQIPWRGKPAEQCPDGRRYKALGNSWGVNAGEYIFDRMRWVESLQPPRQ